MSPFHFGPSAPPLKRNVLLEWREVVHASASAVFLLFSSNVSLGMAVVPKGRKIVNDTTPMMCTIEGIAKKEHVVRK